MRSAPGTHNFLRLKLIVRGAVQGVGFRPFVFRLAEELGLKGWVKNSSQGVFMEVEGARSILERFLLRLEGEKPPRSYIQSLESSWLDPVGFSRFEIRRSNPSGAKTALVLPDVATCPDCLREIFDPQNRRHFYPFTNCTNCGPRFSIIENLPYDRPNTSMKKFTMCPRCQAEYDDPRDRRFHAQPNACPLCGPHLELWDSSGKVLLPECARPRALQVQGQAERANSDVLRAAAEALRAGKIVAVKGLGGFHLLVAAGNEDAVCRLRQRKHREEKPLALMFPSLASVQACCEVSPLEERMLRSPEAPIVLLRRRAQFAPDTPGIAASVAPSNPNLGAMLPYTPLHHLLLSLLQGPVVATSGNLSDEPICTDEPEAVERLHGIADLFLVHNRPIVRHVDDSIARVMAGREMVLRRARGFAPLPVQLPREIVETARKRPSRLRPAVLAVGAHLKNTIALSVGQQAFLSQHIGDLETEEAYTAFTRVIADLERLYEARPSVIAADAHPDYLSTKYARARCGSGAGAREAEGCKLVAVQHHVAHVFSCMAENELNPPVLGVSWDGTGYGLDGTVWGGEFFHVTPGGCDRVAHFRPFRLPGGDQAVKEPRRTALGLLFEAFGEQAFAMKRLAALAAFSDAELKSLKTMLERGLNSPRSSSVGRIFDAVASLAGLRQRVRFEGQAAMELEFALEQTDGFGANGRRGDPDEAYPIAFAPAPSQGLKSEISDLRFPLVLDWGPLVSVLLADVRGGVTASRISARFHNALVAAIVEVASRIGEERVVLTGGCFQNRYLTETAVRRLVEEGFRPSWHQRVPPNDGGIALGQLLAGTLGLNA